jgi:hypothetical protein
MFGSLLPCKFGGCKLSLSPFNSHDLQNNIDWEIEYSQICYCLQCLKCAVLLTVLNCCEGMPKYYFMVCRMHNKRQIRCQIFIKVFEGRNMWVVRCKQLHGWNDIKEFFGNKMNFVLQLRFFLWLRVNYYFLSPTVITTPEKEHFTMPIT